MIWRIGATSLLASVLILCPGAVLQAADIQALSDLLLPVDMAQNFAMICSLHNPAFLRDTSGPEGSILWYAQHIKQEVIAALPEAEARAVVVEAADVARDGALKVVHHMGVGGFMDPARVNAWCETSARPFIASTIVRHDSQHPLFDQMIARAKQ